MSDKPGTSKRAMEQASEARVKLRRVEEIYKKNSDEQYYIVTDVSNENITVQPVSPVVEEPITSKEEIESEEKEITIQIEEHGPLCDPLNIKSECEESQQMSSPINNIIPQIEVCFEKPEPPPYLIELKKTLGKVEIHPPAFTKSVKKVSIPGPWTENDCSMQVNNFTKKKSWLMPTPDYHANYFDYFIDDGYLNGIVIATNQHASYRKTRQQDSFVLRNWIDLTVSEFKVFIGLLLHTGTSKHKLLGDYWRQHRLYKSCFPDFMPARRFTMILQYLAFPGYEPQKRICHVKFNHSMADNFNNVMKTIYYPGRELSISINKVTFDAPCEQDFSLKVVALHKADEPIVKIIMDTRRNVAMDVEAVMCKILEDKHKVGHALYVDSATTPIVPAFALFLFRHGTYCTGILDENRFQVPDELNRVKLKTGESKSVFHGGLHLGKHEFKDGPTIFVTSEFKKETGKQPNQMPEPLRVYNEMTSNTCDPHYDIVNNFPWKTHTLGQLKKLFIYTLLISIWNASKLCNMFSGTKYNFQAYRLLVLEHLLPEGTVALQIPKAIKRPHRLVKIPKTSYRYIDGRKSVKFTARRDCKNCKNVKSTRINTIYQCDTCTDNPALCLKCFFDLHSFDSV